MTDTERALARALAALRDVLPYAESRAEDLANDVEDCPRDSAERDEAEDLADTAWFAVQDAQEVLRELENRGFPKIDPARLDAVVANVIAGLEG